MSKKRDNRDFTAVYTAADGVLEELKQFAANQVELVRVDGKTDTRLPPYWVVSALLEKGNVGYLFADDESEGFYYINKGTHRNRYGIPTKVYARTGSSTGRQFVADVVEDTPGELRKMAILNANQTGRPPVWTMSRYASKIGAIDTALTVNIMASIRSQIVMLTDEKQLTTLEEILDDALNGRVSALVNKDATMDAPTTLDISVPFIGMDIQDLRQTVYAEALKHFGGITSAAYKAERVQGAEIGAHVAEAIDFVYIMIDTFNVDAERQGVPYRLQYNGEGAKYAEADGAEDDSTETEPIEQEAEGGKNNEGSDH